MIRLRYFPRVTPENHILSFNLECGFCFVFLLALVLMKNPNRFAILDLLRGLAAIGMVAFHVLFILYFFHYNDLQLQEGWYLLLARSVEFTFILLVGICMAISRKYRPIGFGKRQIKRILKLAFFAFLVSLGSYYAEPQVYVRFGILHFMAVASLLAMPFANEKRLSLALAILSFGIGLQLESHISTSLPLTILGFHNINMPTLDLFPIFPWITLVFLGIYLGHLTLDKRFFEHRYLQSLPKFFFPIQYLGRHALLIYVIHIPIIIIVLKLLGLTF